jgi:hypothetical protein
MTPKARRVLISLLIVAGAVALAVFVPMRTLQIVALWYVAAGTTLFAAIYHVLARWWDTAVGQNIMLLMASLALLTDAVLANLLLGRPEWMRWVFLALYVAIGTAAWWRLGLLVKAQRGAPPSKPSKT